MNIEQVHPVDTKPFQRPVKFGLKMRRRIVIDAGTGVRVLGDTGLRRDREQVTALISLPGKKTANDSLGPVWPIDIRCINMRHALIKRRGEYHVRLRLVCRAIEIGKGHRAIADGGDQGAVGAKSSCLHVTSNQISKRAANEARRNSKSGHCPASQFSGHVFWPDAVTGIRCNGLQ